MTLGDILKQYRIDNNISMDEFVKKSSLSKGYISMLENNINPRNNKPIAPTLPTIRKVAIGMNMDIDTLLKKLDSCQEISLQNDTSISNNRKYEQFELSLDEIEYIEKYRSLDPYGKETVSYILDREAERVATLQEKDKQIAGLGKSLNPPPASLRIYTYMHKIASAGKGFYFEDIPTDTIEAPYHKDADFIIGVNGDSMEPTYSDGDMVYVEKCQIVNVGEIGIFVLNNECLIKEAGENGLISHNPKYALIAGNENILCVGKVLGKVTF